MFENIFRSDKPLMTLTRDAPCNACRSAINVVVNIVRYKLELELLDMLLLIPCNTVNENSFNCT
jgi:hypothetical protein